MSQSSADDIQLQATQCWVGAATPDVRLEDYLDHFCAPLVGVVPFERRQELRAELRAHLEALIDADVEMGSQKEVAVARALRQFGDPRVLTQQWAREWTSPLKSARSAPVWSAVRVALPYFGLATAIAWFAVLIQFYTYIFTPVSAGLLFVGLPLLAGLVTGLRAPARHALGTFFAQSMILLPMLFLALTGGGTPISLSWRVDPIGVQACCWLPLGCVAAVFGGWLKGRQSLTARPWLTQ